MFPTRRPFPWRVYLWVLFAILFVALAPVVGVLIASGIADANACVLHEGDSHPCMVGGRDVGGLLYGLFVLGWLMLATIPMGTVALVGWVLVLGVHYLRWRSA